MADGGIMEAALLGAAVGGGTSLVTGQDPLKGALLGTITGGAMSGIGSALGSAGSAGADAVAIGAPTAADSATQALTGAIGNPVADLSSLGAFGQPAELNSLSNLASNVAPQAAQEAGIASINPNATSMMQNLGTQAPDVATPFVSPGLDTSPSAMQGLQQGAQQAAPATQGGIRDMLHLKSDSLASKGLDWWDKQDTLTQAGLGGIGLMGANAALNPYEAPIPEKYKSKLAGYNREQFTPYDQQQPSPYPSAHYAAQGGLMQGYAEGGIAALAGGSQGMGNNQGYPQGQQDHTQYATPTQMPTSASVIDSGYEQRTNPYTGEPAGYAMGGTTGAPQNPSNIAMPMAMQNQNFQGMGDIQSPNGYSGMGGMGGMQNPNGRSMGGGKGAMGNLLSQSMNHGAANFDPAAFRQGQAAIDAQQPQGDSHIYHPHYAAGGSIDSYNLGGYAHGGNPRLLDGPGDGMSDSIPAIIGHKQPARLAQGEFVVPADVVSHLGNGSTDAGAKHLYSMMDNIRKARTGSKEQGKQINANHYMPQQG